MNMPLSFPDWLPWWVSTIILVLALLWGLAFLLVPFSVIGLKARLDGLEARLDEIQTEIRMLTLRLPDSPSPLDFDELYAPRPAGDTIRRESAMARPPIPPTRPDYEDEPPPVAPPASSVPRDRRPDGLRGPLGDGRLEPRLDWPR
jgi:hypothetical protein